MKAKSKLPLIDRIVLWINYLLCFSLVLSYIAPFVNPARFWPVAFFGLAYPPLLLSHLIILVYWLFRNKKYMLLSIATILIGWPVLTNNVGFHISGSEKQEKPGGNSLRVMTYNVHDFKKYGSNNDIPTKHEILRIIEEQQPDVITFQEFYSRNKGQYNMTDSLKRIMKTDQYYFEPFEANSHEALGMAIFSRFPIIAHGMIRLSEMNSDDQCLFVDIKKNDKTIRIYNVHLQSVKFDEYDYRYLNSIKKQDKPEIGSAKRLGSKLKIAFIKRAAQVATVKNHAGACTYPYVIAGDFNDTPASYAVHQMGIGLKNSFKEKGFGLGRTYNGDFPNYQIDYIMASPQFDISSYQIIEKKLSDHYPVRSDLLLK